MRAILIIIFLILGQNTVLSQISSKNLCSTLSYKQIDYTVCKVQQKHHHLKVFWKSKNNTPFASLRSLESEHKALYFSMNAGMYDDQLAPIGLYVENGVQLKPISRAQGWGNFHLKPNGVFYINADNVAGVLDTTTFESARIKPKFATQSGPMLVVNGKLHPKFTLHGMSRKYRNGVGVSKNGNGEGEVYFAISQSPVTFTEFATLFKDKLKTQNALYLDGSVSSLRSNGQSVQGDFRPLGPMIGAE